MELNGISCKIYRFNNLTISRIYKDRLYTSEYPGICFWMNKCEPLRDKDIVDEQFSLLKSGSTCNIYFALYPIKHDRSYAFRYIVDINNVNGILICNASSSRDL